jgi:AraC-like DNA-binding protein/ATP/maltotriose-dependent transcriptional regulator MalT
MFSRISDEINEIIQNAKQHESVGRYDDAAKILAKYWKNTNERPDVSGLNQKEEAEILLRCGSLARYIGICQQKKDVQKLAKTLLAEARDIFSISVDIEKVAECATCLALVYLRLGQLDEARSWINHAFNYQIDKKREVYFYIFIVEGMLLIEEGKYQELVNKCLSLETLFQRSGFLILQGDFNNNYACGLMKIGDKERAISRFKLARYFYTQTKHYLYLALLENNLAIFYKDEGLFAEAHDFAESARGNFKKLGDKTREGYSIDTQAQIYLAEGKYKEALKCANEAIAILQKGENYLYLENSLQTKSHIQLHLKDYSGLMETTSEVIRIVNLFGDKPDKQISTVKETISSNFHKSWKVEELAETINLSKSRFKELFKQKTQLSPIQFVRHLRFEKAKELLEKTHLTVKQIGFAVGINDQSHFVRDFKKKYGISPTEYRNKF